MKGWAAALAAVVLMTGWAGTAAAEEGATGPVAGGQTAGSPAAGGRKVLVVASGEAAGYYFPVAGALCRILDKERPDGTLCAVMPTSGSAANIAALRSGTADLAIVQSRAAMEALRGNEGFAKDGAYPELRVVMSLHAESTLVMTRPDSGIATLADIRGKRVNLGMPGSFQRAMADAVLDAAGLSEGDMAPVVELDLADEARELCAGNLDVAFFSGVHPMAEVSSAIEQCGAVAVPYTVKAAELKRSPWLSLASIKGDTYDGVKPDLPVLGVRALLVAPASLPADQVRNILKAIYANFRALDRQFPVLKGLSEAETAREGMAIPLHEGAQKFFAEKGLTK